MPMIQPNPHSYELPRTTNTVPAWIYGLALMASSFNLSADPADEPLVMLQRVTTNEFQPKTIPLRWASNRAAVPSVLEAPRHGSITVDSNQVVYAPAEGYMGRDSFLLSLPITGGIQKVRFMIRVLPRYIPLVGAFVPGPETAALYDSWSRSFVLCDPADPTGVAPTLNCRRLPTKNLPPANYFPMVWPDARGTDQLALYDSETGLLTFLELHDTYLEARDSFSLAPMTGGWPVLGDWDGSGRTELAMVFDDGRVFVLGPAEWEPWPQTIQVPSEDATLWPIAVNRPGNGSSLAYISPTHGGLSWLACGPTSGCSSGYLKSFVRSDFRRPVGWDGARFLVVLDSSLQLVAGKYSVEDMSPHTIPIKFPDDPSGGG